MCAGQLDGNAFLGVEEDLADLAPGKGQLLQEAFFKLQLPNVRLRHGTIEQPLFIVGLVLVHEVDVVVNGLLLMAATSS